MMKRTLLIMFLVLGMTGCTDTINSVTREYRNLNNEALDAMMMVTNEAQAKDMTIRIFDRLRERYDFIDRSLDLVRNNRTKKEFIMEVFESEGARLYLDELPSNCQRYTLEITRLKNLQEQYLERAREAKIVQGEEDPIVRPSDVCPALTKMVAIGGSLDPLVNQLTKPKLRDEYMRQMKDWKVKEYSQLLEAFQKKREALAPKPTQQLVN